jgi:rubrerythrin
MAEEPTVMEQHTASRRAVLSAASLAAGGILVAGIGAPALGSGSKAGDVEILNFALQLEELKVALYTQALLHANLTGDLAQYARIVGRQEREHVAFLRKTLGSAAQPAPVFDFGDAVTDANKFGPAARMLEDLAVAAFDGQGAGLTKPSLAAVATIVSVEARHAAMISALLHGPSSASAGKGHVSSKGLDSTMPPSKVLVQAKPFIRTPLTAASLN